MVLCVVDGWSSPEAGKSWMERNRTPNRRRDPNRLVLLGPLFGQFAHRVIERQNCGSLTWFSVLKDQFRHASNSKPKWEHLKVTLSPSSITANKVPKKK